MGNESKRDEIGGTDAGLLKAVVETAVDGILTIDPMGTIITANPATGRIFGYPPRELIGQNVRLLMPSPYHEEHDNYLKNYRETGERKIIGIGREVRGLRKDGTVFPVYLAVAETPTDGGPIFTGIVRDISERKLAEEELRRERALLKAVVETAVDGIITIDEEGTLITANPATERIFGYSSKELIGQNVKMLMPSPYQDEHDQYLKNYKDTRVRKIIGIGREVRGVRKSGEEFPLELAVSETPTESGPIYTGLVRDITERKHAEEMFVAKESAERANLTKIEFLSRMSHELRTPLNGVLGFAQLLEMRNHDPEVREATHAIIKAGQHLLNLINEILDLSSIEAGSVTVSLEPVAIWEVVTQAVDLLRPISDKAGVPLLVDDGSFRGDYVVADRRRLLQVFINVISNAIKYNRPSGQVRIWGTKTSDNMFRIHVADNGQGISTEDQVSLFQPFMRFGDLSVEGSGLGLVLSRNFLDLMGGSIELSDSGDGGSTFCIDLKITEPSRVKTTWGVDEAEAFKPVIEGERTVLYIEDNLSNFRLLELAFADWGLFKLIPAIQGQVGLEIAREHHPDLILLDLHLPDMSGLEVIQHLKRDPGTKNIPVIVISADATQGQVRALMAAGAYEYLTKPVDLRRIATVVEAVFKNKD